MTQAAIAVIERYGLGALDSYTFTTHNSGNDVFMGSAYIVKLYTQRKGDGTKKENRLCDVLRYLVPTPEVIALGRTKEGTPYLVSRRMRGSTLQLVWDDLSEAEKRQYSAALGKTLAVIHNSPTANIEDVAPRPRLPLQQSMRKRAKELLDIVDSQKLLSPETIKGLWDYCNAQMTQVNETETVLLHGGFRPGNLIVADGRVTGVIDWEDAYLGDPAEELALVLHRTIPEAFHKSFLTGYQTLRPLPFTLGPLRLVYPLLYYLKFLPEIPTWKEFPTKQANYKRETKQIVKEIFAL
jgi:Ser/Thr protein kinase RdoA (MazF antagonist)